MSEGRVELRPGLRRSDLLEYALNALLAIGVGVVLIAWVTAGVTWDSVEFALAWTALTMWGLARIEAAQRRAYEREDRARKVAG